MWMRRYRSQRSWGRRSGKRVPPAGEFLASVRMRKALCCGPDASGRVLGRYVREHHTPAVNEAREERDQLSVWSATEDCPETISVDRKWSGAAMLGRGAG